MPKDIVRQAKGQSLWKYRLGVVRGEKSGRENDNGGMGYVLCGERGESLDRRRYCDTPRGCRETFSFSILFAAFPLPFLSTLPFPFILFCTFIFSLLIAIL